MTECSATDVFDNPCATFAAAVPNASYDDGGPAGGRGSAPGTGSALDLNANSLWPLLLCATRRQGSASAAGRRFSISDKSLTGVRFEVIMNKQAALAA